MQTGVIIQGRMRKRGKYGLTIVFNTNKNIIKKLKFQINDSDLGIASIHPTEIVNCNELWVYNTKTRKMICFLT